ncbi:aspartate carbamoyltransferase regulatory subunit [Salinibius halmophilus]|uniref:aspartate carbamoyltransferase regulatory subunit n=1 Tax=Salinibius halmophilus TaxID=1853216 RepID=UPI000E671BEB|nr:aspartate carbamoyltransferase regulatory subunit [Salinibius halmophilus]
MSIHKLQVEAIQQGTVIDHIPAGNGLKIINRLQLLNSDVRLTVGLNLPSGEMGCKDLIKVDQWRFTQDEAAELALFAPNATINVINDYKVVDKFRMSQPEELNGLFDCPNHNCITHNEPVDTKFYVRNSGADMKLRCHYCERSFSSALFG